MSFGWKLKALSTTLNKLMQLIIRFAVLSHIFIFAIIFREKKH